MRPRARLAQALRDRVAGPDAARRAAAIWLAPGERRFHPGDPISRVHSHAAMYAGGIRALLLQSLHPLAMAGVGEHSGYRSDPWGRLQGTSEYIAMTTFGPEEGARAAIERVRRVHTTVRGEARDGRPYSAEDPVLLHWVHVAEIDSFLTAHQHYARTPLTAEEADTYVAQTAWAAEELGVLRAPRSTAELAAGIDRHRTELAPSPGALDAARFLLLEPPLPWAARPGYWSLAAGGVSMLPPWAREMLGIRWPGPLDRWLARPVSRLGTAVVGWALADPADPRNAAVRSRLAPAR